MIVVYLIVGVLLAAGLLWLMGNYTVWLPTQPATSPRLLMLHQVTDKQPASGMNMPPVQFEQLLKTLQQQGYQSHFVSELPQKPSDAKHWVCLTFDDGFMNNFVEAFPLLQRYQMKATIYLATQIADIDKLDNQALLTMQQSGLVQFGAHTQDHVNLLKLDDEAAVQQIAASKAQVEQIVGYCDSFAYPFGRFDERHVAMVKQLGFSTAVSTRKKIEPVTAANVLSLPRISTNGTMNALQLRIALAKGRYKL